MSLTKRAVDVSTSTRSNGGGYGRCAQTWDAPGADDGDDDDEWQDGAQRRGPDWSQESVSAPLSWKRGRAEEEEAGQLTARAIGKGEEEQDGRGADGDRDAAVDGHFKVCGRPQELALHEEEDPW